MSDDIQQEQEPVQGNNTQAPQEVGPVEQTPPAQESFGSFPEQPDVVAAQSAYENPAYYDNPVVNNPASYGAPPYGAPLPYGVPPVTPPPYGYAVPPQGFYGQPPNE